jgi:hypothetical protein
MKDKIGSFAQSTRETAKGLADAAQEKAGSGAEAVRGVVGRIGEIGPFSSEAAKVLVDDLNQLLPAIKSAGYGVQGLDLDVAIPPHVAVHCRLESEVAEGDRQALLASLEGHRIAAGAIGALFQVADLQKKLAAGNLKPTDVILDLGVSPGVKVRYREGNPGAV